MHWPVEHHRTLRSALAVLPLLLSSLCAAAEPQYVLDSSFRAPTLTTNATAARLLVLPDGRFFAFSNNAPGYQRALHRVNGEPYGSIVLFKADGTVDPSFRLDPQLTGSTVNAVARTAAGKLVIACIPSNPAVDLTNRVLRLNADGSIDPTFNEGVATPRPNQPTIIQAIAEDGDGKLVIAGQFGDFNNSGRPWVVRLQSNGAVDPTFAAVALTSGWASELGVLTDTGVAIQPDRKVLIAGAFETVNGVSRPGIARLLTDGAVDTTFVPQGFVPADNPQTTYAVRPIRCIALQSDGKIFLGGVFNPVYGNPGTFTQMVVRLHPNGTADSSFNAYQNRPPVVCHSLRLQADGRPVVAYYSTLVRNRTSGIARYQLSGAYDDTFASFSLTLPPAPLFNVAPHGNDGRVIFAGVFHTLAGLPFSGIARTNTDGTLDSAFRPGELQREALPSRLAQRRDGRILVSGTFDRVNNIARAGMALLERDGSLSSSTYGHSLTAPGFFLHNNDKLLLFGNRSENGQFVCTRFNADTTIDTTFSAAAETMPFQHANLQPDGRYLLSSGTSAQAIANEVWLTRINPDGSKDPTFTLGIDEAQLVEREESLNWIMRMYAGDNRVLAVLPDEKILYHYFDRDRLHKVVRLNPDGAIDPSFQAGVATPRETRETFPQIHDPQTGRDHQPNEGVIVPSGVGPTVALREPDGRIIVAGQFTSYNGTPAGGIVRLNADGSLSSTFGGGAAFTTTAVTYDREPGITEIQRDYAGLLLVAGDFDTFHGVPSPGIARLNADGSLDPTFVPPIARRNAGNAFNNRSALARQAAGSFLLAGNYAARGSATTATSIFRLEIPTRAAHVSRTPAHALQIGFTGVPGETYRIERSSNVMGSSFIDTGARMQAAPDGTFIYEDASAFSSLQRFYRAVTLP